MDICKYIYTYTFIYICLHLCIFANTKIVFVHSMCASTKDQGISMDLCAKMSDVEAEQMHQKKYNVCKFTYTYIQTYIYIFVFTCIYMYIYIYIRAEIMMWRLIKLNRCIFRLNRCILRLNTLNAYIFSFNRYILRPNRLNICIFLAEQSEQMNLQCFLSRSRASSLSLSLQCARSLSLMRDGYSQPAPEISRSFCV